MALDAKRLSMKYEMTIPAPREQVFPMLCPVREYDWLPYWNCRMIYSLSGVAEQDCVFMTDFPDRGEMIWTVTRYSSPDHIQYTICKPDSHILSLNIVLEEINSQECRLTWRHVFTGFTKAGNQYLVGYTDEHHRLHLSRIEKCLVYYVKTGNILKEG